MFRSCTLFAFISLVFVGCSRNNPSVVQPTPQGQMSPMATPKITITPTVTPRPVTEVVFPIAGFRDQRTVKVFGQYVSDRFRGYHAGDDIEVIDIAAEVPVYAIADGVVAAARWVSGYGGVIIVRFMVDGKTVSALYGHINIATAKAVGSRVARGEQIALLGEDRSTETDGERKHLHFQMWYGGGNKLAGYVATPAGLSTYIDPTEFFAQQGLDVTSS